MLTRVAMNDWTETAVGRCREEKKRKKKNVFPFLQRMCSAVFMPSLGQVLTCVLSIYSQALPGKVNTPLPPSLCLTHIQGDIALLHILIFIDLFYFLC